MSTSSVRRVAALAVTILLTTVLASLGLSAPAGADAGGGVPGVPRTDASALSVGFDFGCVIVSDGGVRCWGGNGEGQLAQGNTVKIGDDPGESTVPVDLGPGRTAVVVSAGSFHACALLDNGQVRCWGYNSSGQLGQGNTDKIGDNPGESTVPVDLGPGRTAVAVEAGDYHTCAVLDTGQLRCWGYNGAGQLGQGNTNNIGDTAGETTVAVDLGPGRTAVAVAGGYASTCAVLDNGQLRCWGYNADGQLGQGHSNNIGDTAGETTVPVDLGPGRTARAVAAGGYHVCAVLDTGQLRCWGFNSSGQLGQGNTDDIGDTAGETTVAVDVGPGRTVVAVNGGGYHTCAVLDDGQLRCWGRNDFGQLGQGHVAYLGDSAGESTVAVDLGPGRTALAVSGGEYHTCAVLESRQLRCWGLNDVGQLGQGNAVSFGNDPGELPAGLAAVGLGGQLVGRDADHDGVRDAVDACPTAGGTLPNGCPAAVVSAPEAVLKGKKVVLDTVLAKQTASAKCPAKATVVVKTKSSKGKLSVTKKLKTTTVTGGCRVKGTINLHAKPKKTAKVKVTVSGAKLKTKHLTAVRP